MLRRVEPQFSICANALKRDRRSVRDYGIQRLGMANHAANGMLNHALTPSGSYRPWLWMHSGHPCPHPSGGGAVQIGYPADLSGIHAGMTAFFPK